LVRAVFDLLLQEGHGPVHRQVAELIGRLPQEGLQALAQFLGPAAGASGAFVIVQGRGVVVLGIGIDPVVDAAPGYAQQASDGSDGTPLAVFQDGQGSAMDSGIERPMQLALELCALPARQLKLAHRGRLALRGLNQR
jgi:hypothetical protein